MGVSIAQVRFQIGDEPRWSAAPGQREVVAAASDGATLAYYLRFTKAILNSLQVFLGTVSGASPLTWRAVPANDSTNPWSGQSDSNGMPQLVFGTAPAAGKVVAVRYLTTAFLDSDLAVYLQNNVRETDTLTLKAVHYALIPVILNDRSKLTVYTLGTRRDDATNWVNSQLKLMTQLRVDLDSSDVGTPPSIGFSSGVGDGW